MIQLYNVLFVIRKEKYMIKSLMSTLILTLFLSHCTTTDFINVGAALYGGMEKKPNPMGAIKLLKKKDKDDTNN
jgi:hypothetical protein